MTPQVIFFKKVEYLKASLLNRVVCVDPWERGLRGSNFYVGCVDQIFLHGSNFFCVDLCMGQHFLRGSKIFAWVNFFLRWSTFIY